MAIFVRATIVLQAVAAIVSKLITTVVVRVEVAAAITTREATAITPILRFIVHSQQLTTATTFSAITIFTATTLHFIAFSTVTTIAATATAVMVLTVPTGVPAITTSLIKAMAISAIQLFLAPHLTAPFTIPTAVATTTATLPLTAVTCFYQVSFFSIWVLVPVVLVTPEYQRSQLAGQAWSLKGEQ